MQDLKDLIPADFPDHARVWIYQSSRPFSDKEEQEINEQLEQFYRQWQSHGAEVRGWAKLLYRQFIVVMADESGAHVSGCSTDGMVRIIKSLERQYSVDLFDRLSITFLVKGKPEMLPLGQVQYALDKDYINGDTILFNNTVQTKEELMSRWQQPLKESWLAARVRLAQV